MNLTIPGKNLVSSIVNDFVSMKVVWNAYTDNGRPAADLGFYKHFSFIALIAWVVLDLLSHVNMVQGTLLSYSSKSIDWLMVVADARQ